MARCGGELGDFIEEIVEYLWAVTMATVFPQLFVLD